MTNDNKIDFVLIWVDGNDPKWRSEKAKYDPLMGDDQEVRFRDWNNLRYWFRGVEKYAPWVNNIYFVTWGHVPAWLNTDDPKIHVVNHKDFIPEKYLPTFNSHTIELNLHRIPGLCEQFVYFNDDMFITSPVKEEDFFRSGKPVGLDCICFTHVSAGAYNGNNIEIINSNFKKDKCISKDFSKWFSPKNGIKRIVKTAMLNSWPWFTGMYYDHLPGKYLKSSFEEVWQKEHDFLDATCTDKFRNKLHCNQWVIKYWQFAKGICVPCSNKYGHCFHIDNDDVFSDVCNAICREKYKMICINDTPRTTDFQGKAAKIIECFDRILPQKSNYEK